MERLASTVVAQQIGRPTAWAFVGVSCSAALQCSPLLLSPPELTLVPEGGQRNRERLEAALRELDAGRLRQKLARDELPGEPWRLAEGGDLELEGRPAGTQGYRDLHRDAVRVDLGAGITVEAASLLDLLRIAEASPRTRGRADAPALRATLERVRFRTGGGEDGAAPRRSSPPGNAPACKADDPEAILQTLQRHRGPSPDSQN